MNELVVKPNHDIEYSSFKLRKNGLEPIGIPSFEEWQEVGEFIRKAEGSVHFWLGDWLNYGEQKWGEMYAQAIDETGYEYDTLRHDKAISERIELGRRRPNLSWSHHQEVAYLDSNEQDKWLALAENEKLTRQELRQNIKEHKFLKSGKQELDMKASLYGDNIYFNGGEMSDARWDDHYIKEDKYPTLTRLSRFYHKDATEFTLREYARVQDFPDDFKFVGSYSAIKSQLGNAVSPKMAEHVGKKLTGKTFIDIFAGCGGLSCGLERLGKKAVYAIERDRNYFQTYIFNFPNVKVCINDIRNILEFPDADIVVGGPPCQGFSLAGLRLKDDPRNEMYKEFIKVVESVKPKEFLMENVKEISSIKDQVISDFNDVGYDVEFEIVHGPDIGMKQTRTRAFFIGKIR